MTKSPGARAQLKSSLDKVVRYEREERYAELYDLLFDSHIVYLKKLRINNRADFVRNRRLADVIVNFEPLSISLKESSPVKTYLIKGMVSSKWGSKIDKERGSLIAYLKDGTWYFGEIGIEIDDEQP